MKSSYQISFITPVYNEEHNIARMIQNLYAVLQTQPTWSWEMIFIEDGSLDNTLSTLKEEVKKYPHTTLIVHDKNKGFNASLQEGIQTAKGDILMYIGADEEFDSTEIPLFISPILTGKTDLVTGVRWQRNAYSLPRLGLSLFYTFLLNWLFTMRINDYNWSQAWRKSLFEKTKLTSRSLFILPEIIIRAHDLGLKIVETPSNHRARQSGKSSLNKKIMAFALWEALCFWRYRRSKKYLH